MILMTLTPIPQEKQYAFPYNDSLIIVQLNVYRNGNPAAVIRYKLKESLSLQEHVNYLKHKFKFKETDKLRIFNTEGLEIYPEDFKYLKDDSSIFISKGKVNCCIEKLMSVR